MTAHTSGNSRIASARTAGATLARSTFAFDALAVGVAAVVTGGAASSGIYCLGVLLALAVIRPYGWRLTLSVMSDVPLLEASVGAGVLVTRLLAGGSFDPSVVDTALVSAVLLPVGRTAAYAANRRLRRDRVRRVPTIVVGGDVMGRDVFEVLTLHPEYGLDPIGFVDDAASGTDGCLGSLEELDRVLLEHEVGCIIVAFGTTPSSDLVRHLRSAARLGVEIYVVPRFFELGVGLDGRHIENLWGIPVVHVCRAANHAHGPARVKRAMDVAVASAVLVLSAPVLAAIALTVKATSRGPVLFRQRRVGQHGREIHVLKFRTMTVNDDSETTWSVINDSRQTTVGRVLRKLSLDELPQLWNVFRGDMSLVGPRPERPHFVSRFVEEVYGYGDRHRVPAGLTGLAQIHGLRGDTSIKDRSRFDNYYIEHWSLWRDVVIIVRTFGAVVRDAKNELLHRQRAHADEPQPIAEPTLVAMAERSNPDHAGALAS